jgi:hypothetical protein
MYRLRIRTRSLLVPCRASSGTIRPSGAFSVEVSLGCSLGRLRSISSMSTGTSPFTGYLPLSRIFFYGSTFNNYLSYKSLLVSEMFAMYSK